MPYLALLTLLASSQHQVFSDFTTPLPLQPGDTLVLGIVGGWERWDAEQRIVRRIALKLRDRKLPNVYIETVENHKLELAQELIEKAFPHGHHRLIIYGQSLGGAATLNLCHWLHEKNIPVELAITMDSISLTRPKVPPNVKRAANLYQRDLGFIRGHGKLQAQDPSKTQILANIRYRYPRGKKIDLESEPWIRRTFMASHLKFEYDPEVWAKTEELILEVLVPKRSLLEASQAGAPSLSAASPTRHR
jgi:hypothetical protein